MKVGDIVVAIPEGFLVKVDTIVDEIYFNGTIVGTNNIDGMEVGEKGYYFVKNGFKIKQNIGGIKMEKLFELKQNKVEGNTELSVVELVVLNKELLKEIVEKNGVEYFKLTTVGIGINLRDILDGKDLVKLIPTSKVELLRIVLESFEIQFLGDGEEEDVFYSLSVD
ncbi:MAG: hypothetical protein ACRC7S_07685, partial [Cetobacterium sp.]